MLHVIYDGQCGFCVRALRVCRAFDLRATLRFHDSHDARIPQAFPELAAADVDNAMFVVDAHRRVFRGFFGFRRIARALPAMWPFLLVLYFPGSGRFGPTLYAWIARNRHWLGCESAYCELPGPDAPQRR